MRGEEEHAIIFPCIVWNSVGSYSIDVNFDCKSQIELGVLFWLNNSVEL